MTLHAELSRAVPGFMKSLLSLGLAALVLTTVSTMVACGSSSGDDSQLLANTNTSTPNVDTDDAGVSEADLQGTPCTNPGGYIVCHDTAVVIDGFKYCDGTRICDADSGTWGTCVNNLVISSTTDGG